MLKTFLLLAVIISLSCDFQEANTIHIKSDYPETIDSIIVKINFRTVLKLINISQGFDTSHTFNLRDYISAKDVTYEAAAYKKGAIFSSFQYGNDYPYIPRITNLTLIDSPFFRYTPVYK
jgi:hypothetical protein